MSQFERISYIDRAIHERGAVTTREVATHFENSERQIKRDIEYMRDRIGMSLVYDYTKRAIAMKRLLSFFLFLDRY
jgi:DeoR/GlpR family transcriptional regulator of sugar metabolism